MGDYVPVACMFHERLEFAVLRRLRLDLYWRTEAGDFHVGRLLPVDVATREGAEWLTVRHADGQTEEIRLDRILAAQEIAP